MLLNLDRDDDDTIHSVLPNIHLAPLRAALEFRLRQRTGRRRSLERTVLGVLDNIATRLDLSN